MTARTIAEKWESFERETIPPGASHVQRNEMKNAFYAGFISASSVIGEIISSPMSEVAMLSVINGLHDEISWHFKIGNQDMPSKLC